ncbi:hypothetical protein GE061_003536 [Apolygus lucorum]|uniref:BTB domain-containing protein n=1 Tax=Apolygus lucorum TaxID=248454 RepID=A0A8S9X490_APOLU|nr:hypothetical protein GE061_003536 [Apolygus lucorum]
MTTVLRQLLVEKKPMVIPHNGGQREFGRVSVRGLVCDWSIPYNFKAGSPTEISSPQFSVPLNGRMTTWRLHYQRRKDEISELIGIKNNVWITLKYTGLLLPPPYVCVWLTYQDSTNKVEGKGVLMSLTTEKRDHILVGGIKPLVHQSRIEFRVEFQTTKEEEPSEHVVASLLKTKRHLDAKIVVEGETFEAHKVILSEQSAVLADKLETNLPEYHLDDISPAVFKELLCLMYMTRETPEADSVLHQILSAANKYKLRDQLIRKCESNLIKKLRISNAASLLAQAHEVEAKRLKSAAINLIVENLSMLLSSEEWKSLKQHPSLVVEIIRTIYQL